jgi:phosphoribosylformimino-5-aminoimidazole carboxamide ribotide isomerase
MIIYPAIDLRNGKCIRLYQGDYKRETVYSADPIAMAKGFVSQGTTWLHVVDLDGAKNPEQNQVELIGEIIKTTNIKVQTGGGIRNTSQIEALLNLGAERIIVGSMAVKDRETVSAWFKKFGAEKIVLALDVMFNNNNEPMVALNAWQDISKYALYDVIDYYKEVGLAHLLCTNISLDGTLSGPDYVLYDSLLKRFPFLQLQASGGVQSLTEIVNLRERHLAGVIIGRALYENKFTLQEVLSC